MLRNPADYAGLEQGPGKFESEPRYVRYYYEAWLEGHSEDYHADQLYSLFEVTIEESEAFDLTAGGGVVIWESEQGFVYHQAYKDASEARLELVRICEEYDETEE